MYNGLFWFLATAPFYRIDRIRFMAQALMNNFTTVRHYEYDYLHKAAAELPFTGAGHNWILRYYEMNFIVYAKRIRSAVSCNLNSVCEMELEHMRTLYMWGK